jgi:hypothetical protein
VFVVLKPEVSLGVALATGALVYGIFQTGMPSLTDVRVGPAQDGHINASRMSSTWTAAGIVAGVSLIAKDPTVFVIGGAMVIALDWWYRHANATNPLTGLVSTPSIGAAPMPSGDLVPGMTASMVS